MPNTLATGTWVVNESGERFTNSLAFFANINRSYDDQFSTHDGAKIGYTVLARLPFQPTVADGQAWQPQGIIDRTVPVTLRYQKQIGLNWSAIQEARELAEVRSRYINPSADALASVVDATAMADCYKSVYKNQGTPGTTPTANTTWLNAKLRIFDAASDLDELKAVMDGASSIALQNANVSIFNPQQVIAEAFKKGRFANQVLGIAELFDSQSVPKFTTGSFTSSTPIVDNAGQTGSSITTTGWASGATSLKQGDCIEFAGVYEVNPLSRVSTGRLAQFTLTADISDTTGAIALPITPSIVTSGPLQNVTGSPAANAVVYVWNTRSTTYAQTATVSPQNLIFRKDAFIGAMADLANPVSGAKAWFARSKDFGFSIRVVQQYLLQGDQNGTRLDCIFGADPFQTRMSARVVA